MKDHYFTFRNFLILVLLVVCALEVRVFSREVYTVYQQSARYMQSQHGHIVRPSRNVTIDAIQPWMTFGYINFVLKLPPNYLQDALTISDPRYPNIQISLYAKENNESVSDLVNRVTQALKH